jgi:hypothetical protein
MNNNNVPLIEVEVNYKMTKIFKEAFKSSIRKISIIITCNIILGIASLYTYTFTN